MKKYLENNTYNLIKDEDSKEIAKEKIKNNIPIIEENVKQISCRTLRRHPAAWGTD